MGRLTQVGIVHPQRKTESVAVFQISSTGDSAPFFFNIVSESTRESASSGNPLVPSPVLLISWQALLRVLLDAAGMYIKQMR